jgi:hypothetical protein
MVVLMGLRRGPNRIGMTNRGPKPVSVRVVVAFFGGVVGDAVVVGEGGSGSGSGVSGRRLDR